MEQPAAAAGPPTPWTRSPSAASGSMALADKGAAGPGHAGPLLGPGLGYASWTPRLAAGLLDRLPDLLAAALLLSCYVQALLAAGRARSLGPQWSAGAGLLTAGLVALILLGDWTGAPVGMLHVALRGLVHALDALTLVGYLWPPGPTPPDPGGQADPNCRQLHPGSGVSLQETGWTTADWPWW